MGKSIEIKIQYQYKEQKRLKKIAIGDWIDLYTAEDIFIRKNEYREISLGVAMKLPDGYEAIIRPRSSTYKKYGILLANSEGIIDNSYCGPDDIWHFLALCLEPKHIKNGAVGTEIKFNTKICQFRIQEVQPEIIFREVEKLDYPNRGGLGSTGD